MSTKLVVLLCLVLAAAADISNKRRVILESERSKQIGGRITLTPKELVVNNFLLKLKQDDFHNFDEKQFLASKQFPTVKSQIDSSKVYQYIKRIPKGASLHTHVFNAGNLDFVLSKINRDDLYVCDGEQLTFHYFPPDHNDTRCEWKRLQRPDYEAYLKPKLTIGQVSKSKIEERVEDINAALSGLLTHREVFEDYIKHVLHELEADRIQHVEFRGELFELYETAGTGWSELESFGIFNGIITNATKANPNAPSVKYIYVPSKDGNYMKKIRNTFYQIHKTYPNLMVGLDLHRLNSSEQEDVKGYFAGRPGLKYFSQGGKTNWHGLEADTNILDAFLLGSSRIGHVYSLYKHPELMNMIKENNVGIEVCPISDQGHRLISDFRNHPASSYIANGLPVIIGNDRPMLWGASGLSHDWYVTYMAMSRNDTGLAFFKELALNSVFHAAVSNWEKDRILRGFYKEWNELVEEGHAMIEILKRFG